MDHSMDEEKGGDIQAPARSNLESMKEMILKFHAMVTKGCGRSSCPTPNCASNKDASAPSSTQDALQLAIRLCRSGAQLCEPVLEEDTVMEEDDAAYSTIIQDPTAVFNELLAALNTPDPETRLSSMMASPRSFAAIFLPESDTSSGEFSCTNVKLEEVYERMSIVGLDKFRSLFCSCCTNAAASLKGKQATLMHIRYALLLLQCDYFLDPESHDDLKHLFIVTDNLDAKLKDTTIRWLSAYSAEQLSRLVGIVQSYLTVRWYTLRKASLIAPAVVFLSLLNDANNRSCAISYEEFYNEVVNEELDLKNDYIKWQESTDFCFARYPFILDAASKSTIIQLDAGLQMRDQLEEAVMRFLFQAGDRSLPYLVLRVNRDTILEDTLRLVQGMNGDEFKKTLKVKFIGEEGVDEGGLQKEFFQLLIRQLFNPEYAMFVVEEDSHVFWFNKDSFESSFEFELIGILLGLAIYNSVILDIRFPLVVYKKLLGIQPTFADLEGYNPSLYRGMRQLLEFDGDVEETYARTFSLQYSLFGEQKSVLLKPGGDSIPLTKHNRQEYVDLFTEYTFTTSIATQFSSFKLGFELVCGGDPLKLLRPEELEMAVCGSSKLDFNALEAAAQYENFSAESEFIANFWSIVHAFDTEQKRKFLAFCTGSDRVPINGLGALKVPFVIARNGADSERLPTSHTCFNHLLLPEYNTLEKLRERLLTAISNSEGFGLM